MFSIHKPAILLCILYSGFALAQADVLSVPEHVKTGWSFGLLPAVSYNSDLGFQYGGVVNFFHHGDGSSYPKYNHSLFLEISRFTKGSGINRFFYDSEQLIPNLRTTADLSLLTEKAIDFMGLTVMKRFITPNGKTITTLMNTSHACFTATKGRSLNLR